MLEPEELAQQGYAKLLEQVLEELDFFTEPWIGSAYLGGKMGGTRNYK